MRMMDWRSDVCSSELGALEEAEVMSAAMLMQLWGDTILTTALRVLSVLLIRMPCARHFGARLTYSLWLIPALRLILPPLPFADPVTPQVAATSPETTVIHWTVGPQAVDAGSDRTSGV